MLFAESFLNMKNDGKNALYTIDEILLASATVHDPFFDQTCKTRWKIANLRKNDFMPSIEIMLSQSSDYLFIQKTDGKSVLYNIVNK
jgi:hypothetical protein